MPHYWDYTSLYIIPLYIQLYSFHHALLNYTLLHVSYYSGARWHLVFSLWGWTGGMAYMRWNTGLTNKEFSFIHLKREPGAFAGKILWYSTVFTKKNTKYERSRRTRVKWSRLKSLRTPEHSSGLVLYSHCVILPTCPWPITLLQTTGLPVLH